MGSERPWKPFEYEVLFLIVEVATDYSFSLLVMKQVIDLTSCEEHVLPFDIWLIIL